MLTHCVSPSQRGGTGSYSVSFQHRVHYKKGKPISLPSFIARRDQPVQRFGRFACVLGPVLALAVVHHLHWTLSFQCVEKNIWLAATSQLEKQVSGAKQFHTGEKQGGNLLPPMGMWVEGCSIKFLEFLGKR